MLPETEKPARSREIQIVREFIALYCRKKRHQNGSLCCECSALLDYALLRLQRCPYHPKPPCRQCPTHCYHPEMRQRIRKVMKFSGMYYVRRGRLDWLIKYFLINKRLQPEGITRISNQAEQNAEILAEFDSEFDAKQGFGSS